MRRMEWSRNRRAEASSVTAKKNRLRNQLLKGLSIHDFASLVKFDLYSHRCVFYDYSLKSVFNPCSAGIPWPIVWLLSRYSQKHIFMNRKLFDPGAAMRDIDVFLHKLRWRRRLGGGGLPSIRVAQQRNFNPFTEEVARDDFDQWVQAFRNHMHEHVSREHENHRVSRRFSNMLPLHKCALRLLKQHRLLALPQDKNGGFAVIPFDLYGHIKSDLLHSAVYEPCEHPDMVVLKFAAKELCGRIAYVEREKKLAHELMKPLAYGKLAATLHCKVKTHKPEGEIGLRALHASTPYIFEGLGKWASKTLRDELKEKAPNLLRDTADLMKRVSRLHVDESTRFLKVDVKEFFYSGTCSEIVSDSTAICKDSPKFRVLVDVVQFLTHHQYVEEQGQMYRVARGSGMGLPQSSDVCDSALHIRLDTWLLKSGVRDKMRILDYFRFRDDLLIVYNMFEGTAERIQKCIQHMRVSAGYFRLQVEHACAREVTYLDLKLVLHNNMIVCVQAPKPQQGAPLDMSSAHHRGVHASWPMGQKGRITSLCTRKADAKKCWSMFEDRFKLFSLQQPILTRKTKSRADKQETKWLPVGFHPDLAKSLNRAVHCFISQYSLLTGQLFGTGRLGIKFNTVQVCWRNQYQMLEHRLGHICK